MFSPAREFLLSPITHYRPSEKCSAKVLFGFIFSLYRTIDCDLEKQEPTPLSVEDVEDQIYRFGKSIRSDRIS
jgi:hypothetical protein